MGHVNRKYKSAFAKVRCGIAPLGLKTGRYSNGTYNPPDQWICVFCDLKAMDDEMHALCRCSKHDFLRQQLYYNASLIENDFMNMSDEQKLVFLMSNEKIFRETARTCYWILVHRNDILYHKNMNP